jgi:hypothetical protein
MPSGEYRITSYKNEREVVNYAYTTADKIEIISGLERNGHDDIKCVYRSYLS